MNWNVKNEYGLRNGKIDPKLKVEDETPFKDKVEEGRKFIERCGGPEKFNEILKKCDEEGEVNIDEFLKQDSNKYS